MSDFSLNEIMKIYTQIKNIYNNDTNKEQNKYTILQKMGNYFEQQKPMCIYLLKVLMETRFVRDVSCQYNYIFTPDKCGCDLRELVFNFSTKTERDKLLKNIRTASNNFNVQIPHILTDIDDTLFPNYNGFLETMGSDTSWKSHSLYPGISKFYKLFYKNLPIKQSQYSTVLTGTPVFLKNKRLHDKQIYRAIGHNYGFIQGFDNKRDTIKSLLSGMIEQPFYKFTISSKNLAENKFNKFMQYRQLFPEYRLLFIGDNGQGDLLTGLKMLENDPQCLVFIHNILKYNTTYIFSDSDIQKYKHKRLFIFKNYLELSVKFAKLGYLKFTDLFEIQKEIRNELEILFKTDKSVNFYNHYNSNNIPKILRIVLE